MKLDISLIEGTFINKSECISAVLFYVLYLLHADYWSTSDGLVLNAKYMFKDTELSHKYGDSIGKQLVLVLT